MSTNENKPNPKRLKKRYLVVIVVVILYIIGSLSGNNNQSTNSSSSAEISKQTTTQVDLYTKRACRKWYEAISEGSKGTQTTAEIRESIKVVYESAKFSEIPAIVDAATRQLAAITIGDVDAFSLAGVDFGNACKAVGQ